MKFDHLGLAEPILRAIAADGYHTPTPIQAKAIPIVLEGHDLLGCAQTGTGKTAAFALPLLHRLMTSTASTSAQPAGHHRQPQHGQHQHGKGGRQHQHEPKRLIRGLILCPTRELASQIGESITAYGRHLPMRHAVIFGGVSQFHQVRALTNGVDILVATPGRLMDLMQQGHVHLGSVKHFVLDEADRMLDMGFIPDIRRIVKHLPPSGPGGRQTLLFSATMPADIRALAESILRSPMSVQVNPVSSTVETIAQSVYFVDRPMKPALLAHLLTRGRADGAMMRTLVFTRTKRGADKVVRHLTGAGIKAEAIHGNKSQNARTRAMTAFKSKVPPVLVATDIASRGIDVDDVTHVINFDMPDVPETYVHRIGRTARAGASGCAISFCDHEERGDLKAIERLTKARIDVVRDVPVLQATAASSGHRDQPDRRRHLAGGHDMRGKSSHSDANGRGHSHASGRTHSGDHPRHAGRPRSEKPHQQHASNQRSSTAASHGPKHHHGKPKPQHQGAGASSGHAHHGQSAKPKAFGQRGRGATRRRSTGW